jgi:glycerol dehydrogenase
LDIVNPYFPHAIFRSGDSAVRGIPRVLVAPQRYVQGDGVFGDMARYLALVRAKRVGLLASARSLGHESRTMTVALEAAGIGCVTSTFQGECSLEEIEAHTAALRGGDVDCLLAVGGGKCIDTGKGVAFRLDVPLVVAPSLASNDAPCSAVSVLYSPEGVSTGVEFYPNSPAIVVVDTGVIAAASPRYLVSGMGDAMATWYEAAVCWRNPSAVIVIGTRPTVAANAIGEACARTLFSDGVAAAAAVAEGRVDDALDRVVEANTLLSGIGFESGGLAAAHGVAQAYTALPAVEANFLHGEMVAMGTLTQLMIESKPEEARRVAEFFADVGLPVRLAQLGLDPKDENALATVAEATLQFPFIGNMPMSLDAPTVLESILAADTLGALVAKTRGDTAYRRLHQRR